MSHDQQLNWIICPACSGLPAQTKTDQRCPNCQGSQLGYWHQGSWIFVRTNLSSASISIDKFKITLENAVDIFANSLVAVILVAYLTFQILQFYQDADNFNPWFWQETSFINLVFWLNAILILFIFYRRQLSLASAQKIKYLNTTVTAPNTTWPSTTKTNFNVIDSVTPQFNNILASAYKLASDWKHQELTPLHFFAVCASQDQITQGLLFRLKIDNELLFKKISHQLTKLASGDNKPIFNLGLKKTLISGYLEAYARQQAQLEPYHCLAGAWLEDQLLNEALYDLEIDYDKIHNVVVWQSLNQSLLASYKKFRHQALFKPSSNMDRAYTAVATPILERYSYDLTLAAKLGRLDICVGRTDELTEIFANIKSGRNGMVLVGETGVGKAEIIAGVAQMMVAEDVPKQLRDKRLLELDLAGLLGGAGPAQAQEHFMVIANEIINAGNIILYIPQIENLTGLASGAEGSLDLSEILVNSIKRNGLVCLATSTSQNYREFLERGPIGEALPKIEIAEPSGNQAIQIIESKISWLESKYQVYFSYEAIADAVNLSSRYLHDKYLPEKALDILEKTAVLTNTNKGAKGVVDSADVATVLSNLTHINVTKVNSKESEELLHLEDKMHQRLIGQNEAVDLVCQSLRRARVELREGKRPIASFLFLGPTGVGKTELAKTLAEVYFGREDYMVRVDMSEYQSADALTKMIGSPSGESGYLTEKVRLLPFTLILLDEIEKATPDILNLFLQVLDDGHLTDGQGRTIDFTNTIIIATSNIGAVYLQEEIKKSTDISVIKQVIIDKYLVQQMRPELINRFDGIVVFKPLDLSAVTQIAGLMLNGVRKMLDDKGISLTASDQGLAKLAELGYHPEFGARPLRRLIQDKIENDIANKILAGAVTRRDQIIINDQAEVEIQKAEII